MLRSIEADIYPLEHPEKAEEAHDLVLAKCVAGRERDWEFARDALEANLVAIEELLARLGGLPITRERQDDVRRMLTGLSRGFRP